MTYGSHAMYDIGKILVAGRRPVDQDRDVINVNGPTPTVTPTASMAYGRRQHNLTVLADGTVLATGRQLLGAALVDMKSGRLCGRAVEPGDRAVEDAVEHAGDAPVPLDRAAAPGRTRAVRRRRDLRDCDEVGYLNKNAEIFSPPYLFAKDGSGALAPRPTVTRRPRRRSPKQPVHRLDARRRLDQKVALVRLGAVTHSNNMEQRYVPLQFTAGTGTLTATAPANVNIAPPGYYMLFIVNSAGVPSVAPILNVTGAPAMAPTVQITGPASGSTFSFKSDITITATARDSDGTVQKVEFFAGTTKLGQSTTAPYSFVWHRPGPGTYALTARATDNAGLMTTSARVTVTVGKH